MKEQHLDDFIKEAVDSYPQPDARLLDSVWENVRSRTDEPDTAGTNKTRPQITGIRRSIRRIAIASAAALFVAAWFTTPVQAFAERVYKYFFPDKPDAIISLEGTEEHADFTGKVVEFPDGSPYADYGIYIDEEIYTCTVGDNLLTAQPKDYTEEDMQRMPVYMTISQVADTTVETETKRQTERMTAEGALDPKLCEGALLKKYSAATLGASWFDWEDSYQWDGAMEDVYIFPNGHGGVFVITSHYFAEAIEGHCARIAQMIDTVEIFN